MSRTKVSVAALLCAVGATACPADEQNPMASQSGTTSQDTAMTGTNATSAASDVSATSTTTAATETTGPGSTSSSSASQSEDSTSSDTGAAPVDCEVNLDEQSCMDAIEFGPELRRCEWLDVYSFPEEPSCELQPAKRCVLVEGQGDCFPVTCSNFGYPSAFTRVTPSGVEVLGMDTCRVPVTGDWTDCQDQPESCTCWCELLQTGTSTGTDASTSTGS